VLLIAATVSVFGRSSQLGGRLERKTPERFAALLIAGGVRNVKDRGTLLTKKEYEQLVKDVNKGVWPREHSLPEYWEIGRKVVSKLGNPPYGKAKIQKVARDAGTNFVTVYQCRTVLSG